MPQARGVNVGPLLASPQNLGSHRPPHYSPTPSPSGREYSHFQPVFQIPEGMEALKSLCELLLSSDEDISLTRKIRIARELTKGINYVHTFNFVHKNIRPESVVRFEGPRGPHSHIFLVGFDAFREAGTGTMMAGDMSWDKNVLGVCLLEIGLWEPFVEYSGEGQAPAGSRPQANFCRTSYRFQSWMREGSASSGRQEGPASFLDSVAFKLKDYLVEVARTKLAPRMGEQYARVVLTFLTCLDDDNEDFDGLSDDTSDDVVAVYFIETVMKLLDGISV
ncbi:hypothetical protein ZTR_08873 [Talaromyces verruculosus]|nr:hypothetical protein ZTR_08873 [Talaromyces verruculosus]